MKGLAKGPQGNRRPSIASLRAMLYAFRHHLWHHGRPKKLDKSVTQDLSQYLKALLQEGMITDAQTVRYITDPDDLQPLATAVTSPKLSPKAPRSRPMLLFITAMEIQEGTRDAVHVVPTNKADLESMTYSHFEIIVSASGGPTNNIRHRHRPPRSKTDTTKDSVPPSRDARALALPCHVLHHAGHHRRGAAVHCRGHGFARLPRDRK